MPPFRVIKNGRVVGEHLHQFGHDKTIRAEVILILGRARNLIFIGSTGTGRTHLAIAIVSHCVKLGHRTRYFSMVDLVNQFEREK